MKMNTPIYALCYRFPLCKRGIEVDSRRARGPSFVLLLLLVLTLTACKIDLSINGIGAVKTDTGTFDCTSGSTTSDCGQQYVTDITQCTDYNAATNPTPDNCTVVTTQTTETFTALPGDNSSFGGWGNFCFDVADLSCRNTIAPVDAESEQQVDITATFDPEPTPQDASYTYNHLGQRASKTVDGVKTYFVYSDIDGQLLGEYSSTGSPIREYIYLEGERVAMYDYTTVEPKDSTGQKAIVYFHNDQVGQVQFAFNSDGQMIYERIQTPFGETMGEMNVYNVQVPVRFPGQYADAETGYSDNWNRSYDPSIGRYVQSDPIGLRGGVNTFGYTGQNPIAWIDKDGRDYSGLGTATGLTQGAAAAVGAEPDGYILDPVTRCMAGGALFEMLVEGGVSNYAITSGNPYLIVSAAAALVGYGVYNATDLVECVQKPPKKIDSGESSAIKYYTPTPPKKQDDLPDCPKDYPDWSTPPRPDCTYTYDPITNSTRVTCSKYH